MTIRPYLAHVLVAAVVAAGCVGPAVTPGDEPASVSTRASSPDGIELFATLGNWSGVHVANLSAHNNGSHSRGIMQSHCVSGHGAWQSLLRGPNGTVLQHRDPAANYLGCPGRFLTLAPGDWWNWTAQDSSCTTRHVCDNYWDGRLWPPGGGAPIRAPAGDYVWEFTFSYSERPHSFEGSGPVDQEAVRSANLSFPMRIR